MNFPLYEPKTGDASPRHAFWEVATHPSVLVRRDGALAVVRERSRSGRCAASREDAATLPESFGRFRDGRFRD